MAVMKQAFLLQHETEKPAVQRETYIRYHPETAPGVFVIYCSSFSCMACSQSVINHLLLNTYRFCQEAGQHTLK